jgi:hypothetical protein
MSTGFSSQGNYVKVISGASGSTIRRYNFGDLNEADFIANADDLNADGIDDLWIITLGNGTGSYGMFYSGATGLLIKGGASIATHLYAPSVQDYNSDGIRDVFMDYGGDLIIGSIATPLPSPITGPICMTGAQALYPYPNPQCNSPGAHIVAIVGDADQDGFRDFAAGNFSGALGSGFVQVRSAQSSPYDLLHSFQALQQYDAFGWHLMAAPDYDDDGEDDILVTAPWMGVGASQYGYVRIFSSVSGAPLYINYSDTSGDSFGHDADRMADVDADGIEDLVIASPGHDSGGLTNRGRVQIFPGPAVTCNSSLALQNEVETEIRMYKASGAITAGNHVTSPPYGDYVVSSTANVTLISGTSVDLDEGFSVEDGATFSAVVDPAACL